MHSSSSRASSSALASAVSSLACACCSCNQLSATRHHCCCLLPAVGGGNPLAPVPAGATVVVPLYLGEVAPSHLKGAFGSLNQFTVTALILVAQALGLGMSTSALWPWMVAIHAFMGAAGEQQQPAGRQAGAAAVVVVSTRRRPPHPTLLTHVFLQVSSWARCCTSHLGG